MNWTELFLDTTGSNGGLLATDQLSVFACLHSATRTLGPSVLWHAKFTGHAQDIVICRIDERVGTAAEKAFTAEVQQACTQANLGGVSARTINMTDAFSFRNSKLHYYVDDVVQFLPIWRDWSDCVVSLAHQDHAALLAALPDLHRATRDFLCDGQAASLKVTLAALNFKDTDVFVDRLEATISRTGLRAAPSSFDRLRVHMNLRHLLFNTIAHGWQGDCQIPI